MSSINANIAARTAPRSLNQTMSSLQAVQSRISRGRRVGVASDNAAYWSIAATMRSDHAALSIVQDVLNLGAPAIDAAAAGLNAAASFNSAKSIVPSRSRDASGAVNVSALVDAEMSAESGRLQALQAQQQHGVQALSVANQSSQAILKLFG
jgi:flagellin-like hook-associated protein FlgL